MKKKHLRILLPAAAAIAVAAAALNTRLTLRHYTVESAKVSQSVRVVLLTDLHACDYGEGQRELLGMVEEQHPDLVLLGGDILDDDPTLPEENAWTVIETLGRAYPTFYVTGNHEFWSGRAEEMKARIAESGVTVLEGEGQTVVFQGQPIHICGIDDPAVGTDVWQAQLASAAHGAAGGGGVLHPPHPPAGADQRLRGAGFRPHPGRPCPWGTVAHPIPPQRAPGSQPGLFPRFCRWPVRAGGEHPHRQPWPG